MKSHLVKACSLGITFITSLFIIMITEAIQRKSVFTVLKWSVSSFSMLLLSTVLISLLIQIFYFLPRKKYYFIHIFFYSTLIMIGLISRVKYKYRGEYLSFFDLKLINEVQDMTKYIFDPSLLLIVILFIFVIIALIYSILKSKISDIFNNKMKLIISGTSLLLFAIMFYFFHNLVGAFDAKKNVVVVFEQVEHRGLVNQLLTEWKESTIEKPANYLEETIKDITNKLNINSKDDTIRPNIILVQNEALWDVTLLENIKYSSDPIPTIHNIMENYPSGYLVTPVYGGGTVNTEYEVLTGLSTAFVPTGAIPYQNFIHQPMETLATTLRDQEYNAFAIHSYPSWFYRRDQVYKLLGFERFISMEFINNPMQIGPFYDDIDLYKRTIEELRSTNGKDFIQVVTMLNHGPYSIDRFNSYTTSFTEMAESELSDDSRNVLMSYTETLSKVDESVKYLIESLKNFDEPTIVVMYGDHLPLLGTDYSVYRESGYLNGNPLDNEENYLKMHETPLFIWSNYDEGEKQNGKLKLSSNFLGGYVLKYAGLIANNIFSFTNEIYDNGINVIYPADTIMNNIPEYIMNEYSLLSYDSLLGNQYSYNKKREIDPNYILGSQPMKILGTYPNLIGANEPFNQVGGNSIIGIHGEGFTSTTVVYVNGEKQNTLFDSSQYVSAVIPKKFFESPGSLSLEVRIYDDKNRLLSKSNPFQVTIK